MTAFIDIAGKRFGRWTVLAIHPERYSSDGKILGFATVTAARNAAFAERLYVSATRLAADAFGGKN
jgi:hypothetical protein